MKKYLLRNKNSIFILIINTIISRISIATLPIIIKLFIDNIPFLNLENIIFFSLLFIFNVIIILIFEYLIKIFYAKIHQKLMIQIKNDMFSKIFNYSYKDFFKNDNDYYINLFIEDTKHLYNDYYDCLIGIVISIISLIVYTSYMIFLNWIMAISVLFIGLFSLIIPKLVGKKLSIKRKEQSDASTKYIGKLKDLLAGYLLSTKYTRGRLEIEHNNSNENKEKLTFSYIKYRSFVEIFGGLSLYILNIFVFITGLILIYFKKLELSSFVAFLTFTDVLIIPIRDIIFQLIGLKSTKEINEKFENIINYNYEDIKQIKTFCDSISFEKVSYKVGDFQLSNVNLRFYKNNKYAIVGKTGSGKTTLLKLLLGYYLDYTGSIKIDDTEIEKYDISNIMAEINQNTYIFNASAMDNITLFNSYKNEFLDKYISQLNANNIIRENLGEYGNNISGGEKNKIAILRALNKGCTVMICDEMFSGLDENSRIDINKFLFENKEFTAIVVTHDISFDNLINYDYIIIMDNGLIKEVITKDKLTKDFHL